jgi:hypothetical protein|tara:strand:- start:688 stop:1077 length:390 start_codon:yes stop_codon:yes gene_type:complete
MITSEAANKSPIPYTKGYAINLITHEVFNASGKRMKPFVDKRGRVSIKLRLIEDDKQRVFVVKDIVIKMMVSGSNEKKSDTNDYASVLVNNIEQIVAQPKGLERYQFTKKLLPNVDVKVIRKFLSFLTE